jgi:hypothetical protein
VLQWNFLIFPSYYFLHTCTCSCLYAFNVSSCSVEMIHTRYFKSVPSAALDFRPHDFRHALVLTFEKVKNTHNTWCYWLEKYKKTWNVDTSIIRTVLLGPKSVRIEGFHCTYTLCFCLVLQRLLLTFTHTHTHTHMCECACVCMWCSVV